MTVFFCVLSWSWKPESSSSTILSPALTRVVVMLGRMRGGGGHRSLLLISANRGFASLFGRFSGKAILGGFWIIKEFTSDCNGLARPCCKRDRESSAKSGRSY